MPSSQKATYDLALSSALSRESGITGSSVY